MLGQGYPGQHPQQYMQHYDQYGRPVDQLLNTYLAQEGIDRRYSQVILRELYDATNMNNEQLNQAANEIILTKQQQPNK